MTKLTRFEKDGFGLYQVIDNRNEMKLKGNIKTIKKAAAYAAYYQEQIEVAIKGCEG